MSSISRRLEKQGLHMSLHRWKMYLLSEKVAMEREEPMSQLAAFEEMLAVSRRRQACQMLLRGLRRVQGGIVARRLRHWMIWSREVRWNSQVRVSANDRMVSVLRRHDRRSDHRVVRDESAQRHAQRAGQKKSLTMPRATTPRSRRPDRDAVNPRTNER